MTLDELLQELVTKKGSDLFITTASLPMLKVNGHLLGVGSQLLDQQSVMNLIQAGLTATQFTLYEQTREANVAIHREQLGRFRISAFWQQGLPGMVIRRIETQIPTFDELALPTILQEVALAKRGLVLFVGATGSGKSTTQAAMIGYRNQHLDGHILTVEDPVEFVHQHGRSLITQREVGSDTQSFAVALKNSLRQAPDVILIGEIRNEETMELALQFAETGHLCLATLHANNSDQALDRILHLVAEKKHRQILFDLSCNLRAIVAQQLINSSDNKKRCAAFEIMLNSPLIIDIIAKGDLHRLKDTMSKSTEYGMQTFDQALFSLYRANKISYSDAIAHADSVNDLRLLIKLSGKDPFGGHSLDHVTVDE